MPRRMTTTLTGAALAALALASAQPALAKAKPEISYYLARTEVSVTVTMTLLGCPENAGDQPKIDTNWTVAAQGAADPEHRVRVDVSSGFLAKRSNAFEFNPNGTLAAFNGSSEGQGGAFIGSLLKVAGAVAPLLAAPLGTKESQPVIAPGNRQYCTQGALDTLAQLATIKSDIRALEDKVLQGTATSAELALLERRRTKRAALVAALTIEQSAEFNSDANGEVQGQITNWLAMVDLSEPLANWFTNDAPNSGGIAFDQSKLAGIKGFGITINPLDPRLAPALPEPDPDAATAEPKLQRSIIYRVPVLAKVVVLDLNCTGSGCSEVLALDAPLPIGQWGAVRELPEGSAGIFGSRQASASFDQFGTPIKLSYGSDSGAAAVGSTLEAAGDAANVIADSETTSLERQVKKQELRNKLRDLQTGE